MSKETICPECGSPIVPVRQFCDDCGAVFSPVEKAAAPAGPSGPSSDKEEPMIGEAARVNVGGSINKTSTSNTNVQTTNNVNTSNSNTVNTSSVDNSSTVHNNTTIVMNGEKVEYCQVCGDPLGERHARCPKCGKQICFDCKVKGKNRCVECEKKSVNEYRMAYQQLLLTTNGNIGLAGRQMMDQKARDLDVEDVKAKIENEFKAAVAHESHAASGTGEKRIAVPETLVAPQVEQPKAGGKGKSPVGIIAGVAAAIVVAVALILVLGGKDEPASDAPAAEQTETAAPAAPASKPASETRQAPAAQPAPSAPAAQPAPASAPKPAAPAKDADFEAGMAAYNSGKGPEAVNAFTKSGSAESHYMLGVIYKDGCGSVGKNEMKAHKSFKKAASMGHEGAKAQL